jgi:hypothetical protein
MQRYEVWKYPPNFLLNPEEIPKFAAEKEKLSVWGFKKGSLQKIILEFRLNCLVLSV